MVHAYWHSTSYKLRCQPHFAAMALYFCLLYLLKSKMFTSEIVKNPSLDE